MINEMILLPKDFIKTNSMPCDPIGSVAHGKQTPYANCFMIMFPIDSQSAMPFDNTQIIIDGIHNSLAMDQGLIEVNNGITKNQNKYIYSIIKSKKEPSGIQYVLTMHLNVNNRVINIQAFFDEVGITGQRDSFVLNKLISDKVITLPDMNGWRTDPYDVNYKKGLLMNLSEKPEYDLFFAHHPLSEARSFIKYIIENN